MSTTIDIAWLRTVRLADVKLVLAVPEQAAAFNNLLRTNKEAAEIAADMINQKEDYIPVSERLTPEDEAAIAADQARADAQADADAAQAPTVSETPTAPAPPEPPKKKVLEYQVTADDNTPLGRPTHIEWYTEEELIEKMKAAHVNAVRYAERMKRGKAQSAQSQIEKQKAEEKAQVSQVEADAAIVEASKDVTKMPEAVRKVSAADRAKQIAEETNKQHGIIVANAWFDDHKEDFLPCESNIKMLSDYLKTSGPNGGPLLFTYDNLELAFEANKERLAKPQYVAPVEQVSAPPTNNPPVVAPANPPAPAPIAPVAPAIVDPVLPVEVPASQPAPTTPAPTPVAATNTPAARRPGVNSSLQPGSFSAPRPTGTAEPAVSTRSQLLKEISKMEPEKFRLKLKDGKYRQQLVDAGIPVVGHSA